MQVIDDLFSVATGWINTLVDIFKSYSTSYPKWILYLAGGLVLAKFFKLKVDLKTGGRR